MRQPQRPEKKKKSTKPKYCPFAGVIKEVNSLREVPKVIECPTCKRRMKPYLIDCGCGWDCACYIQLSLKKHRMKH